MKKGEILVLGYDYVFWNAWYQLNHASMRKSTVRSQVVTWFGNCSYRKLRLPVKVEKVLCPICGKEDMALRYFGGKVIVINRNSSEFESNLFMDALEDGREVFSEVGSKEASEQD